MTVAELKQELTRIGLPVSGKKTELISRLTDSEAEKIIFDAEIIEENQENGQLNKLIKKTKASKALVFLCVNFINNYLRKYCPPFFAISNANLNPRNFCIIISTYVAVLSILKTSPTELKKIIRIFLK